MAGLSKTDLAVRLNVSMAAVAQWESGVKRPTAENVAALSRVLEVPMPLLLKPKPPELDRKGPLTFRAWNSANTRRANRSAEKLAELVAEVYGWLERRIVLPAVVLPVLKALGDMEEAARECRRAWDLGDQPIHKLGELLESKGVILAGAAFHDRRYDAFSAVVDGRPFIFLGEDKGDRARSRFDAAHELGHLLLHQGLDPLDLQKTEILNRVESEANAFAGAFLLPAETFGPEVADTTLDGFLQLKAKWGTSVQAMVVRARTLDLITETHYRELFRQMGIKGWRRPRGEPLDELAPAMTRSLGRRSLELLSANKVIQVWEIPAALPVPLRVLSDIFQVNVSELNPSELNLILKGV